jgi:hypothetical protein
MQTLRIIIRDTRGEVCINKSHIKIIKRHIGVECLESGIIFPRSRKEENRLINNVNWKRISKSMTAQGYGPKKVSIHAG